MRATALFLLLPPLALAQSPTPRPEDLGTVTGHITCADTQRPARLADVRLVPVATTTSKQDPHDTETSYGGNLPAVQTDLSGGYIIRNVRPGQYYLRADLVGYVAPLLNFTRADLAKPTPEIQQRIQQELQLLTVAPHSTLDLNTTLQRGAAISGTIAFDDGSPATGMSVFVLRRNAKGDFRDHVQVGSGGWVANTDGHGNYRFDSLPPGEYAVEADLTLSTQNLSSMPMPAGGTMEMVVTKYLFSLPVYSGSVIRRQNATPLTLQAGQDSTGVDITIPISTLHDVSGSLTAKDGHILNAGKVQLLFADDRSQFAEVDISSDDNQFHFPYVPEGNYILAVSDARDVAHVEVPNAPGATPRTHTEDHTIHTYGTAEQPLTVQTDLQSVSVIVPDKPSATPSE